VSEGTPSCAEIAGRQDISAEQVRYRAYHSKRHDYVVGKCLRYKPSPATAVLDIGRSFLTLKLCQHYRHVTSLGFPLTPELKEEAAACQAAAPSVELGHIEFDLNDTRVIERLDRDDKFDLIVFGETIEHLVTPPESVLKFLKSLLTSDGIIICQTPNAVALHKRIQMLLGYNPYQRLGFDVFNPGHIREYTKQELIEVGQSAGLKPIEHEYRDYFGTQGGSLRRIAITGSTLVSSVIPSFSRGQTVVYGRDDE
jgi:2-polyprenyl-3-methyl-5-hydroxy-6-metoxy-1,4-benzoquinol methylase